jgi:hypothetical protein
MAASYHNEHTQAYKYLLNAQHASMNICHPVALGAKDDWLLRWRLVPYVASNYSDCICGYWQPVGFAENNTFFHLHLRLCLRLHLLLQLFLAHWAPSPPSLPYALPPSPSPLHFPLPPDVPPPLFQVLSCFRAALIWKVQCKEMGLRFSNIIIHTVRIHNTLSESRACQPSACTRVTGLPSRTRLGRIGPFAFVS